MLAESYSEATQQLGQLRESVDESKGMLKANIEKEENAEEDLGNGKHEKIDQGYIAMAIEMQGIFQQSDIRDEELASLESIAGISKWLIFLENQESNVLFLNVEKST